MGIFCRLFNTKSKIKKLDSILNEIDDKLIEAYQTGDAKFAYPVCATEFVFRLHQLINANKERLFGMQAYRIRTWKIIKEYDNKLIIHKTFDHDHIKITKRVSMAIGDMFEEEWTITKPDYKVMNIVGVKK